LRDEAFVPGFARGLDAGPLDFDTMFLWRIVCATTALVSAAGASLQVVPGGTWTAVCQFSGQSGGMDTDAWL